MAEKEGQRTLNRPPAGIQKDAVEGDIDSHVRAFKSKLCEIYYYYNLLLGKGGPGSCKLTADAHRFNNWIEIFQDFRILDNVSTGLGVDTTILRRIDFQRLKEIRNPNNTNNISAEDRLETFKEQFEMFEKDADRIIGELEAKASAMGKSSLTSPATVPGGMHYNVVMQAGGQGETDSHPTGSTQIPPRIPPPTGNASPLAAGKPQDCPPNPRHAENKQHPAKPEPTPCSARPPATPARDAGPSSRNVEEGQKRLTELEEKISRTSASVQAMENWSSELNKYFSQLIGHFQSQVEQVSGQAAALAKRLDDQQRATMEILEKRLAEERASVENAVAREISVLEARVTEKNRTIEESLNSVTPELWKTIDSQREGFERLQQQEKTVSWQFDTMAGQLHSLSTAMQDFATNDSLTQKMDESVRRLGELDKKVQKQLGTLHEKVETEKTLLCELEKKVEEMKQPPPPARSWGSELPNGLLAKAKADLTAQLADDEWKVLRSMYEDAQMAQMAELTEKAREMISQKDFFRNVDCLGDSLPAGSEVKKAFADVVSRLRKRETMYIRVDKLKDLCEKDQEGRDKSGRPDPDGADPLETEETPKRFERSTEENSVNIPQLRSMQNLIVMLQNPRFVSELLDFRTSDWVKDDFLEFADRLAIERQREILKSGGSALDDAFRLAQDILATCDLEIVPITLGEDQFDSRLHIARSSARMEGMPEGAIARVVRNGFRYRKNGLVLRQPEVIVNRI